jgi:formate-dependent nitrite reductase membrane component NrfD
VSKRPLSKDSGVTHYGMQAVKPTPFGWHVGVYLTLSALSGASQIIAAIAERFGRRRMRTVVRNGRYLAFAGGAIGPLLLMQDLKTPRRWYNMLRIFRRTSPMSIGSYVLSAFGAASGATAMGQWLRDRGGSGRLARIAEVPAAAAGVGMLTYTGALLTSTSTPLWASEAPHLSARFAASGIAAGASALSLFESLAGRSANARVLDRLAVGATATYAVLSRTAHTQVENAGVAEPLHEGVHGALHAIGGALSVPVPLACHALALLCGRRSRALSIAAAVSLLAGTAIKRYAYLEAGKASAKRAGDYLHFTREDAER